jgi:hypothetical protein
MRQDDYLKKVVGEAEKARCANSVSVDGNSFLPPTSKSKKSILLNGSP